MALTIDKENVLDFVRRIVALNEPAALRILAIAAVLCDNADDIGDPRLRQVQLTLHCGPEDDHVSVDVEKIRKRY